MLGEIRKQTQSAIVIILFGFIIFVFVFSFGAGSIGFRTGNCGNTGIAAIVNGERIGEMNYQFHYSQQLRTLLAQREQGQGLTKEEKLHLRKQVMNSLVDQTILIQHARNIGLHVTDEERNETIRTSPMFQNEDGQFNFQVYKQIVQRYFQTTLEKFEQIWKDQILSVRMVQLIQNTARVTNEEIQHVYQLREQKVDLEFVRISADLFKQIIHPQDADIEKFLKEQFERVENFYTTHENRYHKPQKMQIAHVFFETGEGYDEEQKTDKREQAELTLDDLKKGSAFDVQVKEYSDDKATLKTGGDLGLMTREIMSASFGESFTEEVFQLKESEISDVLESDKGYHVVKCLKLVPAEDENLDNVKYAIAREIFVAEKATQKARKQAKQLLEGLKASKTLEELTETSELPVHLEVRRTGKVARMAGFIPQLGMNKELTRAAFALTEQNPVPDQVFEVKTSTTNTEFVVFCLREKIEPDMNAFQFAKQSLREELLGTRQIQQVTSWLARQRSKAKIQINQKLLADTTPSFRGQR